MEEHEGMDQVHQIIEDIQAQLARLKLAVSEIGPVDEQRQAREKAQSVGSIEESRRTTIVEGVFDGQNMVGPDGKMYAVPANYASKSKLVEGDIMKLTVTADGSFIYKQIGPVKRTRHVASLVRDDTGTYRALIQNGRSYRLLTASVTYYKGEPGDAVTVMVPTEMESKWAAVEYIIKKNDEEGMQQALLMDGSSGELPAGFDIELPSSTT